MAAAHPELREALRWAESRGDVVRLLPGVYCATADAEDLRVRAAVLFAKHPDAVLTGRLAASLSWWPELEATTVSAAIPILRGPVPGFDLEHRRVDPDLVVERDGVRVTIPELTVLDLIPELGGAVIDEALRRRVVSVASLERTLAMTPGRRDNPLRRQLVIDSRDEPWSAFERLAHRALREAGITGWQANRRLELGDRVVYPDVVFPAQRLILEFDSWEHHRDFATFVADRQRDVVLQLAGWRVLRFTWGDLPTMVAQVTQMLRLLEREPPRRVTRGRPARSTSTAGDL